MDKDEIRKFTTKLILNYLNYLSKWNKSWSLISIIKHTESLVKDGIVISDKEMDELDDICHYEGKDTKSLDESVLLFGEYCNIVRSEIRDQKIEKILK